MKTLVATALVAVFATSAQAAIYDIALTQDGFGDGGRDWFGTVETDVSGSVTSASFLVNGVTYATIESSLLPPRVREFFGATILTGLVFSEPISSSNRPALYFDAFASGGIVVTRRWTFGECTSLGCSFNTTAGAYTISETATPVIPLPAASSLLLAGLGGLSALRRRTDAARA